LKQSDVYHLIGRIYLYKIHLDREENLFSQQWVIRWKEEGKRAFLKAQELYQQKRLLSNIRLTNQAWKPERLILPDSPAVIEYLSPEAAAKDMELFAKYIER